MFGPSVSSQIKFKGKSQHTTLLGGVVSITFIVAILYYTYWRMELMGQRARNLLMSTDYYRDLADEDGLWLKDSEFKVWASFSTAEFDNDDNPWATIRLHYLSNEVT
jgi:hypothetical protein